MKKPFPKSIFELIDSENFRKRTAMYLGANSISRLRLYLDGYEMCEAINHIQSKGTKPPFWLFFYWICQYYNHSGSYYSWDGIILQNCDNDEEKALVTFFERFDEFRKIKPVRLLNCQITQKDIEYFYSHKGRQFSSIDGELARIGPADHLFIIEYDSQLGCSSYHKKNGNTISTDYFDSIKKSIEIAEVEYGRLLAWKDVPKNKLESIYEKVI